MMFFVSRDVRNGNCVSLSAKYGFGSVGTEYFFILVWFEHYFGKNFYMYLEELLLRSL